ncbi:subtilisin-like protein [Xylariaceae sp. FL1272]|nr:subtilisin-like protein [Xylariaceae sp. FL1272]
MPGGAISATPRPRSPTKTAGTQSYSTQLLLLPFPRAEQNFQHPSVQSIPTVHFKLYKGVSFRFNNAEDVVGQAAQVAAMPEVKIMHPITTHAMPKHATQPGFAVEQFAERHPHHTRAGDATAPDTWATHVQTQVNLLRDAGITDAGIRIAIVDVVVDYRHPALVVQFGYDLVGDDPNYDSRDPNSVLVPYSDPLDTIVAAQTNAEYGIVGAATCVKLGMYKVADTQGYYTSDILIAGLNMAYESGADIISGSVGEPNGWSEDPQAVAVQRIIDAGTTVIIAASNQGAHGMFDGATPAAGVSVPVAGFVDNTRFLLYLPEGNYTVNGSSEEAFGLTFGTPSAFLNNTSSATDACSALPADTPDLSNCAVLIHASQTCSFQTQVDNGGTSAVSVQNITAVGMVTESQGETWDALLASGSSLPALIPDSSVNPSFLVNETNTLTPSLSSKTTTWGPSFELYSITDVMNPDGRILSLFPINLGSYNVQSGTSFSTPLVASVYAHVMEATGIKDTATILNMLSGTSIATLWNNGNTIYNYLALVPQQGAGLLQAYDAVHTTSVLDRHGISFNDTEFFNATQNFTVSNKGPNSVTYNVGNGGAPTAYTLPNDTAITPMNFPNDFDLTSASLSFSPSSVFPYLGAAAKMRNVTVLDVKNTTLVSSLDPSYKPLQADYNFLLPSAGQVNDTAFNAAEIPRLYIQMAFGSRLIDAYVISAADDSIVGTFPLANGTYVPSGSYKFRVQALHVFGDEGTDSDWDVAETVPFTIAYQ